MAHRDLTKEDFIGKTVTDFECDAVNVIRFVFEDGTRLAIEVDAMGHGIYGMVACDECVDEAPIPLRQSVYIPKANLATAIRTWMYTPVKELHLATPDDTDLYLRLVAHANGDTYENTRRLWKLHDDGIIEARRWVKHTLFHRLHVDPASILQVHDEQITILCKSPVKSGDATEELENRTDEPVHPSAR